MKKKDLNEVVKSIRKITNGTIEVLDVTGYKNTKSKILVKSINCDHDPFYITYGNLIYRNQRCPKCAHSKKSKRDIYIKDSKRKSIGEIQDSIEEITQGQIKILNFLNYKNTKSKILVKDITCNHEPFYTTYNKIQQGLRCPTCGNIRSKDGERLTHERLEEVLNSNIFFKEYKILNFEEYENIHKKNVRIKHLVCGNEFTSKMNNFFNLHGCPICRTSRAEIKVEDYLVRNKIQYETHKRDFPGLKGEKRALEIDFVIDLGDKKLYLEMNGELHYKSKDITRDRFSKTQKYDERKVEYFLKNGYPFLVIPYWHFNRFREILDSYRMADIDALKKFNLTLIEDKRYIQKISFSD